MPLLSSLRKDVISPISTGGAGRVTVSFKTLEALKKFSVAGEQIVNQGERNDAALRDGPVEKIDWTSDFSG